jgi:hypothetical protein
MENLLEIKQVKNQLENVQRDTSYTFPDFLTFLKFRTQRVVLKNKGIAYKFDKENLKLHIY